MDVRRFAGVFNPRGDVVKKLILLVLCVISFHADASSFVEGSVLTAAELNAAFATADITGGTIDGAIIGGNNPTAIHATTISATVANPSLNYQSPATGPVRAGDIITVTYTTAPTIYKCSN